MTNKTKLYYNKFTGDVQVLSKVGASLLGNAWQPVKVVTNEQGKKVMRMQLATGATVDISERTA